MVAIALCTGRRAGSDAERPRVLAPPPVLLVAAFLAGLALDAVLPSAQLPRAARLALGGVLLAVGGALTASFVAAFVRARTPVDFRRVRTLVTTGPYRLSRNPGYVGMALTYAGVALATNTPWALVTLVLVLVVVDRCVVVPEERHLVAVFGDDDRAYQRRTRRWV